MHSVQEAMYQTTVGVQSMSGEVEVADLPVLAQSSNELNAAQQASGGWLSRWFERLEERDRARERRELEEFLADATDLVDLEARMRLYDRRRGGNLM